MFDYAFVVGEGLPWERQFGAIAYKLSDRYLGEAVFLSLLLLVARRPGVLSAS